ncbi:MAG: metallophosphoesterase [Clostridia bacterium]|nr:metallophosphoesterase [Clostridia bacterium]
MKNKSKGLFDMDKKRNFREIEKYPDKIKELFDEVIRDESLDMWADTFDIEIIDGEKIEVIYHGTESIKSFKKECKKILASCIYSVMGVGTKFKISQKRGAIVLSAETRKNIKALKFFVIGMVFVCIATAVIVVMCNYIGNRNFRETFYSVSSIKVDSSIRVIQLSDLHGSSYGKNNTKLLKRVEALEPDIIICTGDMVDSVKEETDYAVNLAKGLSGIAPTYYVYGNNEAEDIYDFPLNEKELDNKFGFNKDNRDETALLKLKDPYEEKLEGAGIKVLKNEKDTIKVKTMTVDVYGVLTSNPSCFWSYSENAFGSYVNENKDNFKIMAVHEPFIFEEFNPDFWGDLMVCGHTHGGVTRVPVLGPLFTVEGGLFPERSGDFVYGRYDASGRPLIVSSGLENSNVFRINNQPELVVIDINKF